MDLASRIEQFKKMTEADPDNELGHFSLGKAYLEAGRYEEAAQALARSLELNAENSKAYALLAEAHKAAGRNDDALSTARQGIEIASRRGDVMPAKEMAALMESLGQAPPAIEAVPTAATPAPGAAADGFKCVRCGSPTNPLPEQPMRGELGARVHAQVCAACWREWIMMGTKVINEFRLELTDPRAQQIYDDHMVEFLNLR